MDIKKWWKKLKYWKKGLIIGFLLSFIPYGELFIDKWYIITDFFMDIPRDLPYILNLKCDWCFIEIMIFNLFQFLLIGLLAGFIIGKIKEKLIKETLFALLFVLSILLIIGYLLLIKFVHYIFLLRF